MTTHAHPASERTLRLETATIADINRAFESGVLTAEKLLSLYLARIEAYEKNGPGLNAIITLNPKAMDIARALDVERATKGPRGPLHGIPVVVKDVFDTFDMPTTGGFIAMAESVPPRDATIVKRLRDAGAVILAKTNLSDWFGKRKHPVAWSTIAGQVLNPYDLSRVPGYSSSGTGAAIAAWLATVGLGSDTGGSVLIPSADCALVGLLPSQGLVSRAGQIGSSFSQERGGPMGRSVYDVAVVLTCIAGFDADDLSTAAGLGQMPDRPYTEFLSADGLAGARIGILRDMFLDGPRHKDGLALVEAAIGQMKNAGAVIVDPLTSGIDIRTAAENASLSGFERYDYYNHYLARLGPAAPIRSVEEMVEKAPDVVGGGIRSALRRGPLRNDPEYLARRANQEKLHRILVDDLLDRHRLDALFFPFKTVIAPKVGEERPEGGYNRLASYSAVPSLVVPAGFTTEGLPIGVQFLGRPYSEPTLLKLGYAYEQISKNRRTPATTPPLAGDVVE